MQSIDKNKLAVSIGKHIARRCMEQHITQKKLAETAGMTEAAISRYISGRRLPRLDVLLKLADALNCSIDYLLFGVGI